MSANPSDTNAPVLAFDVGGTRIKSGLIDPDAGLVDMRSFDTPLSMDALLGALNDIAAGAGRIGGCGLCVPGLVSDEGTVTDLPGKLEGIVGMDLRAALRAITDGPRVVVNDAVAYGIGESVFGAGRGQDRVVVMTIGTGVGVTVIDGGKRLGGGMLGGGILGGMIPISDSTELTDSGGNKGSIEALCAARRIVDYTNDAGGSQGSVEEVYEAFRGDDPAAVRGVGTYRSHLVRALSAIAHAHAPQAIILGGGPMTPDNPVTPGLEEELAALSWGGFEVSIRIAELGDSAALWGLAHLCREGMR